MTAQVFDPAPVALGPLKVSAGKAQHVARALASGVGSGQGRRVAFANTHLLYCAMRDEAFARTLADFLVLNDGIGIAMLARTLVGRSFQDNLNGTDLSPLVLQALPDGTRVFLVGGAAGVAQCVLERWRVAYDQLEFCGAANGYEDIKDPLLAARIREANPDVLFVAMGNPLQEQWIAKMSTAAPHALWLGVGALFDMVAGRHPRAPLFYRRFRLEWLHRLVREPKRLWKRYTFEVLVIALRLALPPRSRQGMAH